MVEKNQREHSIGEGWFSAEDMIAKYPEQKAFFAYFPKYFKFKVTKPNAYTMYIYCMVSWAEFQGVDAATITEGDEEFIAKVVHVRVLKGILDSVVRAINELIPFEHIPYGTEGDDDEDGDEDDDNRVSPNPCWNLRS